ncbi:glucokinase [bacterium BMS3Bbin09]|nr:glucokinase [bacterium BMS3Bbin09]HDN94973.1 ROK family protein [Nitrospirota bacterium]
MRVAIGIDIGGTNTKFVLVSEDGKVLRSEQIPTPSVSDDDKEKMDDLLVKNLRAFLSKGEESGIAGIGMGVAGLIDRKHGKVIMSPNITTINNIAIRDRLEKEFSLPVILENDANTYAYGEKWVGAGKELNNFFVLTMGTGLGGGLIYNGDLYEGPAEIGHMTIVPSGRYCTCGSYGCLESYASGRAIVDRVVSSLEKGAESLLSECCEGNFYKITPEIVYQTAMEGDSLSREVFREAGHFLGIGIANLINLLNLEAVIIGGGLIGAWDLFIGDIKKEVAKRAFKPLSANVEIIKSTLSHDAGSIGAAGLLLNKISGNPGKPSS